MSQQRPDLASRRLLCGGVRLQLLTRHRENGNFVGKHTLHASAPQSEFRAEGETGQKHQLILLADVSFLSPSLSWSACSFSGQ